LLKNEERKIARGSSGEDEGGVTWNRGKKGAVASLFMTKENDGKVDGMEGSPAGGRSGRRPSGKEMKNSIIVGLRVSNATRQSRGEDFRLKESKQNVG